MISSLFRRSLQQGRQLIRRSASHAEHAEEAGHGHVHELTIFTEGPPTKFQVLKWIAFVTLGPFATLGGLYTVYVGPRIREKNASA